MSLIRDAIAQEHEQASARQVELATELEKVEARIQQLEDLDEQAKQLDGGESPVAAPPSAATPAAPRRKTSTSAGRRPATAKPSASEAPRGQAHTASGASTGGRQDGKPAAKPIPSTEDLKRSVLRAITQADGPQTVAEILRQHDAPTKGGSGSKWGDAVRAVLAALLADDLVELATPGRGGHPRYVRATSTSEKLIAVPPTPEGVKLIEGLVDKILEELETDGGRVARQDLKTRVGNPDPEDFNVAVDRALNLKKINRVSAGGVTGYELAK